MAYQLELSPALEQYRDKLGNPLFLLAQINFEEVPCLEGFPQEGILQFYIADDDFYGANWDNPTQQEGFRVIYFPTISKTEDDLVTDFSFLPEPKGLPFFGSSSLQFNKKVAPVGYTDYEFEQFADKEEDIWEEYAEKFSSEGHKIGGYAHFTQEDPRSNKESLEKYILLLQIDTDNAVDIMWGDSGVGNFFITQTDLEKLDFSKVFYTWDCCLHIFINLFQDSRIITSNPNIMAIIPQLGFRFKFSSVPNIPQHFDNNPTAIFFIIITGQ